MKKFSFAIVLAALWLIPGCGKEEKGGEGDDSGKKEPETVLGTQADITSFTLVKGEVRIEAAVSSFEKKVVIVYMPEQAGSLVNASAEVTLSEGATITPDPSLPLDYNDEQIFKVTSQDGNLTKNYVVSASMAAVVNQVDLVWTKSYSSLGIPDQIFDQGQSQIGFCAPDKFVTHDGSVFDLEGKKLGTINRDGIPSDWGLISLANDDDAHFIATFGNNYTFTDTVDRNNEGAVYIWADGWDKKPIELRRFTEDNMPVYASYWPGRCDCMGLSAAGSWDGELLVSTQHFHDVSINDAQAEVFGIPPCSNTDLHNVMMFKDKKFQEIRVFDSRKRLNGNWSQMISPVSASYDGAFVIGNSQPVNATGYTAWVRQNFTDLENDYALRGLGSEVQDPEVSYDGEYGYGNYSIGHVKAFNWYGTDAAIVISTFWEGTYMTIQPLNPDLPYILRTTIVSNKSENRSSCAYWFDGSADKAYILLSVGKGTNGAEVSLFEFYRMAV